MKTPPLHIQDALYEALNYDPPTGEIRWREDRRRVREGDLAGSVSRDGALVIGFMKHVYQASHIAWFLGKGEWPAFRVKFTDHNPMNLRLSNLFLMVTEDQYASPRAFYRALQAREYRAKKRELRKPVRPTSTRSNVTYSVLSSIWSVRSLLNSRVVITSFEKKKAAEDYADAYAIGCSYCQTHPSKKAPAAIASRLAGGEGALTLQEALNRFAYDPESGAIYRRANPYRNIDPTGTPAVELDENRRPIVRASGRTYSAGMMAWFLHTGDWPKRKQLGYRDKNPKNTEFSNLYLKGVDE